MTYPKGLSLIFYHKVYRLQLKLDLYLEARAAFLMCYYNAFLLERVKNCKKCHYVKIKNLPFFRIFSENIFPKNSKKKIFSFFEIFFGKKTVYLQYDALLITDLMNFCNPVYIICTEPFANVYVCY